MKKRLLTLEDLYQFFVEKNENVNFSSADGDTIVVQIKEVMTFNEDYDPAQGLLPTHLKAAHLFSNRNHSSISEESMTEAIPSFYNRPILGFIHQLSDGTYDFAGHEMELDDEGNIIYKEIPIGVIPESCNAQLVYDEDEEKTYLEVDGYIYEEYTKAADILRNKKESAVSIEIAVDEMSYSASEKELNIDKFHFLGVTILGKDVNTEKTVEPGMRGANITLQDFSADNNSLAVMSARIQEMQNAISEINETLIGLKTTEGGNDPMKFNELLEKYNVTEEDITFDYEGLSDEELEVKFEEEFKKKKKKRCSIEIDGKEYIFEVSMDEKIRALETLVNSSYSEQDNAYYTVKAYEGYVVMIDYWTGKAFKQNYTEESDTFSLQGDRVEVYCTYLTRDEQSAIDEMRSNYSALEEKLSTYEEKISSYEKAEADAAKEAILNSEDYECICESEDFEALKGEAENFSVSEIQEKCDALLLAYAKANKVFSHESSKKKVNIGAQKEESYSPYGSLFANK